jgi:hypothetical protein
MAITPSVSLGVLERQPENTDFAYPTQFRFQLSRIPEVEFFVTKANLPAMSSAADAILNTPFSTMGQMGDVAEFGDLVISFNINESYRNMEEIIEWMNAIYFPQSQQQFKEYKDAYSSATGQNGAQNLQSDATLMLLTSKNNPVMKVNFKGVYPITTSDIQFDSGTTDNQPLTMDVTFRYTTYYLERL